MAWGRGYQQSLFELKGEVAVKHLGFICRKPVDVAQVVQVCNWGSISTETLDQDDLIVMPDK